MEAFDQLFKGNHPHYDRYFDIKFPGCNISEDISPIKLNKDFEKELQNCKVRKSGRNGLFVEVINKTQSEKIIKMKRLADQPIVVYPHKKYNFVKGVIKTKSLQHDSEEDIADYLKPQGITEVRRITIKKNNEIIKTNTYVISFNLQTCPKTIKIADWLLVKVDEYHYTPQQCWKCLKFGHVNKFCKCEHAVCARCASSNHTTTECENEIKCSYCGGNHYSTDKNCARYKCETEVINLQMHLPLNLNSKNQMQRNYLKNQIGQKINKKPPTLKRKPILKQPK